MADDPKPKDDDRLNQLNANNWAWRREASDLVSLIMAQNTMIALLLEKLIEQKVINHGDAFSLLEECLAAYAKDEAAQVPPKWVLDFLRRRFVPPPGTH
jgi:hypothetical protein